MTKSVMKKDEIKVIFFDVGFTLVDETDEHLRRYHLLRDYMPLFGIEPKSDEEFLADVYKAGKKSQAPIWAAIRKWGFPKFIVTPYNNEDEKLFDDAEAALRLLSGKYRLGIIANQLPGMADRLRLWGIYDCFDPNLIFGSADVGLKKPSPEIFTAALAAAGIKPCEALMVGDRPDNDIGPANTLAFNTARVRQGFNRDMPPHDGTEIPDLDIPSVSALAELLLK